MSENNTPDKQRETIDWKSAKETFQGRAAFFPWKEMQDGDVIQVTLKEDLAKPSRSSYYIYEALASMRLYESTRVDPPEGWVLGMPVLFGVSDEGKMAQLARFAPGRNDTFFIRYQDRQWVLYSAEEALEEDAAAVVE